MRETYKLVNSPIFPRVRKKFDINVPDPGPNSTKLINCTVLFHPKYLNYSKYSQNIK